MIFLLIDIVYVELYKYINYIYRIYNLYWLIWYSFCLVFFWAFWSVKLGRFLYIFINFFIFKLREKNLYNYKVVLRVVLSFVCIYYLFIEYKIVFMIILILSFDVLIRLYIVNVSVLYLACMIFSEICFYNKLT